MAPTPTASWLIATVDALGYTLIETPVALNTTCDSPAFIDVNCTPWPSVAVLTTFLLAVRSVASVIAVPAGNVFVTRGLARATGHLTAGLGPGNLSSVASPFLFVESVEPALYEPGESYEVVVTGGGFTASTVLAFLLAIDALAPSLVAHPQISITGQVLVDPTRIDLSIDVDAAAPPASELPFGYSPSSAHQLRAKANVYGVSLPAPGTITLVKTVVNDDGGTLGVADFPLFVGDVPMVSGVAKEFPPGAYTASETPQTGYTAGPWGGDADAGGGIVLASGQHAVATITNDDDAPVVEVPILALRPISGNQMGVYRGTWFTENSKEAGNLTGWQVDYGTLLHTIDWGTPTWNSIDRYKIWLLPDGGGGLGANSVALHIRRRAGDATNTGGQSILRVWNGVAETVTEWTTGVNGRRIEQPVADGDKWWFVEFEVPSGFARLCHMPLDLSAGPTVVQTVDETLNSIRSFWLTSTHGYATEITGVGPPFQPTRIWRFARDGSGSATLFTHSPGLYYDQRDTGNNSGSPYLSTSWRASHQLTAGLGFAEVITEGVTIDVDDLWPPHPGEDAARVYANRTRGAWSLTGQQPGEVMICASDLLQTPGWPALYVGQPDGTGMRRYFAESHDPYTNSFEWVER